MVGDTILGSKVVGEEREEAGVALVGVEGANVLGAVVVGYITIGARVVGEALRESVWRWLVLRDLAC